MKKHHKLSALVAPCVLALAVSQVSAQIAVDGTLDAGYGSALAVQTVNTGFGDATVGNGNSSGGSELDAAYGTVSNGYLYLFFAGNYENNGNLLNIFIADGRPNGQNTLTAPEGAGNMQTMNGSIFSPTFNATYAFEFNVSGSTAYLDQFNLLPGGRGSFVGSTQLSGGIGNNQNIQGTGIQLGVNNTNTAGVVGDGGTGSAADQTAAAAVATGAELGIPLSLLGNPTGNIRVMADINGGGDNYLSNQFLPGLPAPTTNLGGGGPYQGVGTTTPSGTFNFSSLPNEYFSINVPLTNGIWLPTGDGNWNISGNWSNSAIPNAAGALASFSSATGSATVTVDGTETVGELDINNSNSYSIVPQSGSVGMIIMDGNGSGALITDFQGIHNISVPLQLNSNTTITVASNGDQLNVSGNISGSGELMTSSLGVNGRLNTNSVVELSGTNTYTGGTEILKGALQLGSSSALPTGTALTLNGVDSPPATLDLNGNNATVGSITCLDGGFGPTQITTTGGDSTLTYAGANDNPSTFTGNMFDNSQFGGGTFGLTVSSGSLTLSGSNSYYGTTTINNGASLTYSGTTGVSMQGLGDIVNNGSLVINDVLNLTAGNNVTGTGTTTINAGMFLAPNNFNQGALVNNGTITIQGIGYVGQITGVGNMNINSMTQIIPGSGESQQGSLMLSGGTLDITNNALVIAFAAIASDDPSSTIRGYLQTGFASGSWEGFGGINSSTAASTPGTAVGYADGNTDTGTAAAAGTILIRYTWYGDLNLDGVVNNSDLLIMKADAGMTNADWAEGDMNYDGVVNADDFALLQLGVAVSQGAMLPVPEPASLALLTLPLLSLRRRRSIMN